MCGCTLDPTIEAQTTYLMGGYDGKCQYYFAIDAVVAFDDISTRSLRPVQSGEASPAVCQRPHKTMNSQVQADDQMTPL